MVLIGDSITKSMERFAECYSQYFPASTFVNAGIPGDTVEAIIYQAETMFFPSSVTAVTLLCGTNNLFFNTSEFIVATIIEFYLFFKKKCPNAVIYLFPILPRFDWPHSQVHCTYSLFVFFRFRIYFPILLCFMIYLPDVLTKIQER